jgi:hypothetical protein
MIPAIIIDDFYFHSSDHLRYEEGIHTSGPHENGARRAMKIERKDNNKYIVTIFNLDGVHPLWRNNVQMAPKQMEIIRAEEFLTELRGYGRDFLGNSFEDYGVTIEHSKNGIEHVTLNILDRNINIKYLKSNLENLLVPNYFKTDNEYHTLPNLIHGFRDDLIGYMQSLERKQKPDIVYIGDVIDVCSLYAIRLMDTYKEKALGLLPINIVTEVKEQVYQAIASLIPEMEKKEAKETFWDVVNKKLTESNIVYQAHSYLDNLEKH